MATRPIKLERLPTSIPGLDRLLEGGLLAGGVYIVQGSPGAGKTILANQICFNYARAGGQAVYITLLAETHSRMLQHMQRMSFYDSSLIPKNIYYVSGFRALEEDGLQGLLDVLRQAVTQRKAGLLILDGLVSAEEAAPNAKEYKKFINELQVVLTMIGGTALLLSNSERATNFRADHTMVDGIVELTSEMQKLQSHRYLHVRKMRGVDQVNGRHTFAISDAGITVYPRIESRLQPPEPEQIQPSKRLAFGVEKLDAMMQGGLPNASTTMLFGPSGSGKTMLGLQWLAEGARKNEAGVYFGFFEPPPAIMAKCKRVCIDLLTGVERGLIRQVWQRATEGIVDVVCDRLLEEVDQRKPARLFVDGLDGIASAIDIDGRVRDVATALADELQRRGVTVVYTVESDDLVGANLRVPFHGVSAITHNMILLRHLEQGSRFRRSLAVLKMRDSDHDPTARELRITDKGIVIGEALQ